jgi:hypothetical protein
MKRYFITEFLENDRECSKFEYYFHVVFFNFFIISMFLVLLGVIIDVIKSI